MVIKRVLLALWLFVSCAGLVSAQVVDATINAPREDDTAADKDRGVPLLVKRCDTISQSASADGKYGVLCTNSSGYLQVYIGNTLSSDATAGSAALATGPQVMADCDDTATVAGVENAAARFRLNCITRAAMVETLDPCQHNTKVFVALNGTANATIITGTASKKIYVCSLNLLSATTQNLNIISGTVTTCGTGSTAILGLAGGTTAATGWNFVANGGISMGSGGFAIAQVQNNADNLCIVTSSTGQYSGGLSYVVQ